MTLPRSLQSAASLLTPIVGALVASLGTFELLGPRATLFTSIVTGTVACVLVAFGAKTVPTTRAGKLIRTLLVGVSELCVCTAVTYVAVEILGLSLAIALGLHSSARALQIALDRLTTGSRESTDSEFPLLLLAPLISLLAGACFIGHFGKASLNHDTSWYLYATREWLTGATLYVDIVETNPPLIFYLTAPSIWIADLFRISDTRAECLMIAALFVTSLTWASSLLRTTSLEGWRQLSILAGTAWFTTYPALNWVGEREHRMLLFALPYLFSYLVARDRCDLAGSVLRAMFAGVGFCLKPFFLAVPASVTVLEVWRQRSLRPILAADNLVIGALAVSYLVGAATLHPEYLLEVVPLASQVYGAFGFSSEVVLRNLHPEVFGLLSVLMLLLARARRVLTLRIEYLFAASAACILAYAVQWTGYEYQIASGFSLAALASLTVLATVPARREPLVCLVAATILIVITLQHLPNGVSRATKVAEIAKRLGPGIEQATILAFDSHLWPSFPLVLEQNLVWVGCYGHLWPLPGAHNAIADGSCNELGPACEYAEEVLREVRAKVTDDLLSGSPDFLLVNLDPGYFSSHRFDFLEFMSGDPRFHDIIQTYESIGFVENYQLFARVALVPGAAGRSEDAQPASLADLSETRGATIEGDNAEKAGLSGQ